MTGRAALFLDRDGVVCRAVVQGGKPFPARSVEELDVLPGVQEALRKAGTLGLVRIIVTNQPDVARGTLARQVVEAMHDRLRAELEIDDVLVCWHDDADGCACRKPKPGLLLEGAERHGVDLARSFMVGDRWRDVEAGMRAGCRTVWIDCGYDEQSPPSPPDYRCHNLAEAVEWIGARTEVTYMQPNLDSLRIKIFADGANRTAMVDLYYNPRIKGFTTNPTLMRKDGVGDYEHFAREVLSVIRDRPISFEVLSDDMDEMERQARKIVSWGENANVKIPITNTRRVSSVPLIRRLARDGIKVNVTGLTTIEQVSAAGEALAEGSAFSIVSLFGGRIADTGRDPVPMMAAAVQSLRPLAHVELLWASPRELLNIFQADAIGCHIITVTADILKKLPLVGKDLDQYSLETVQMFRDDAVKAGYVL